MTVVNPKSISGINSITTGSGSDNLLTIHTSDANNTERVRVNSDGDVIVGSGITVSPDGDIFATGVTTSTTFSGNFSGGTVSGTTGTFTGDVDIADKIVHTGDTDTALRFPAADTITAETGGGERLRIDSSGHLSFAGTTEEITLQTSDGSDTGYLNLSGGGACAQTRGSQVVMSGNERSGGLGGILQLLAGNSGSTGVIQFFTGGAEKMRLQSGGGISFNGDTATANALDDYEEGTHTITINSGMSLNSGYNVGSYTKIGRQVTYNGLLVISGTDNTTNDINISLPFTNASTSDPTRKDCVGSTMTTGMDIGDAGLTMYIPGGGTTARFYKIHDNGGWATLKNQDIEVGDEMYFTITYHATS